MEFNELEYGKAICEFIIKMEKITEVDHPDICNAMCRVCQLLRIAKVDVVFYNTFADEEKHNGHYVTFYSDNSSPENITIALRKKEITGGGNIADYHFYMKNGESSWSEEELEKINVFQKLLFVFNGRSRLMKIADFFTFHDAELGIHNITYYMKTISMEIVRKCIGKYGACFFNLKGFSGVNHMIGRQNATNAMKNYIKGLESILSGNETVCRVGGDNFALLFNKEKIELVKDYFNGKNIVYSEDGNKSVYISAYAGFYMIPDDCADASVVMDCISAAKNVCKASNSAQFIFYSNEIMEKVKTEKKLLQQLREALEKEEFQVYYQPKVSLKNYSIAGAEALCRWFCDGKLVPPIEFIPVMEHSGMVEMLDLYMIEHVCMDIRKWLDEGRNVVKVSVNCSRCNLGNTELLDNILAIVNKYNIPHEYIEIELTETTTESDFRELKKIVYGLQENGISTAIDDFGVGYSSLNLICDLPWNVIKIDKKFLESDRDKSDQNYLMLKHIISLAQSFKIECIVEGVETEEHISVLKENNCFMAQGFYFDKPLPKKVFEERLDK
ncbi:MAG: EAL domain-containing protein [Oscillospiraceae bacterium]